MTLTYPNDTKAEQYVMAGMMKSIDVLNHAIAEMKDVDFYNTYYAVCFRTMVGMYKQNRVVTLLSLVEQLKDDGMEVDFGLLSDTVCLADPSLDYEWYVKVVKEKAACRHLIDVGRRMIRNFSSEGIDVTSQLAWVYKEINNILFESETKGPKTIKELIDKFKDNPAMSFMQYVEDRQKKAKEGIKVMDGYPTHFTDLDDFLGGLKAGHLTIVGARPGVGKTTFMCNLIEKMLFVNSLKVCVFSLEMPNMEITSKLLFLNAGLNNKILSEGKITGNDYQQLLSSSRGYEKKSLFIDDQPSLTIMQLRSRAIRYKTLGNIDILFIDYLQLMKGDPNAQNKTYEIGEISQGLKILAKELNIPVVALAQLNRKAAENDDPKLHELKDSGSIEQDADEVILLHSPSMNDPLNKPGILYAIVAKNRFGKTGRITLTFDKSTAKLNNYSELKRPDDKDPFADFKK